MLKRMCCVVSWCGVVLCRVVERCCGVVCVVLWSRVNVLYCGMLSHYMCKCNCTCLQYEELFTRQAFHVFP